MEERERNNLQKDEGKLDGFTNITTNFDGTHLLSSVNWVWHEPEKALTEM